MRLWCSIISIVSIAAAMTACSAVSHHQKPLPDANTVVSNDAQQLAVQLASSEKLPWITIFIHGTVGLRAHVTLATFVQILADDIEHTTYEEIVKAIRNDPFFFQAQAMNYQGLWPIVTDLKPKRGDAPAALVKVFKANGPQETSSYYTFGWSGLLSCKARYRDAQQLYEEIRALIGVVEKTKGSVESTKKSQENDPQEQYKKSKIRIIGYSHGGSVGLNLSAVRRNHYPHDTFTIDELIMCGTPVQSETNHMVSDPIFKKIYHVYSRKDKIQTLDFVSFPRSLSCRRFYSTLACPLPDNLTQVEIKIKMGRNKNSTCTNSLHARYRIDFSPSHSEFWFFGWTPSAYREKFPLYPLPVTSLLPSIIHLLTTHVPEERNVIVELRPTAGVARLRQRHSTCFLTVDWLSPTVLAEFKKEVMNYQPEFFNQDTQIAHTQSIVTAITGKITLRQSAAVCWY